MENLRTQKLQQTSQVGFPRPGSMGEAEGVGGPEGRQEGGPRREASENHVFRVASLEPRAGRAGERYPNNAGGLLCGTHRQTPSRPLTAKRF